MFKVRCGRNIGSIRLRGFKIMINMLRNLTLRVDNM